MKSRNPLEIPQVDESHQGHIMLHLLPGNRSDPSGEDYLMKKVESRRRNR